MCHANFGGRDPYFGRTGVRRGSPIVPLDRALVSSYRLSTVTMALTEAVWPQFAMQVFGGTVYPFGKNEGCRRSPNWYHRVAVRQPYLVLQTVFLVNHNTNVHNVHIMNCVIARYGKTQQSQEHFQDLRFWNWWAQWIFDDSSFNLMSFYKHILTRVTHTYDVFMYFYGT